jgi:hypothetical protein
VVSAAQNSFVEAIHSGLLVAVGFMLLAALVAAIFVRSHVGHGQVEELSVDDHEEDEVRKAKRSAPAVTGQQIDPRTEQVLREAFEPPPLSDSEPMPTTEWAPEEPLKPARVERSERRRSAGMTPVRSEDTHYHQEFTEAPAVADPAFEAEADEEEPVTWATSGADSYKHLRMLIVDLPIKAGTGEVEQNLEEVALATLNYYQYGLSQPGGDSLPVGVTNGAQSSTKEDIAILAGYMEREKRVGRGDNAFNSDDAASLLMAALASRALQLGAAGTWSNGAFVRETVKACLEGRRDQMGETPSNGGDRLVYRRRTPRMPGSDR